MKPDVKALNRFFKEQEGEFIRLVKELAAKQTYSRNACAINSFIDLIEDIFRPFEPVFNRQKTANGDVICLSFYPEFKDFVVLLGHIDTVKVAGKPPLMHIKGNRLSGNGVYDMKSGIALFYFVIKAIDRLDLKPGKRIKILLNPDEEIGSPASALILHQACRQARAVIVGEPCGDDGAVKTRRKGILSIEANLEGRAAHSGIEIEKGLDANRGLVELVRLIDEAVKDYEDVTFNPGIISGGENVNVVSPKSRLLGEIRSFGNDTLVELRQRLISIDTINGIKINLTAEIIHPALEFTEENRKLFNIAKKISLQLDYPLTEGASGGASDGSSLSAAGIPVIDGMGMKGGRAHSPDEYLEIDDFANRAALITSLVLEI